MSSKKYNSNIFFKNITKLRKEKEWSQNKLAIECEVSTPFMTHIKNGAHPSATLLLNLFEIFSDKTKILNPFWLFFNEGPQYLYLKKENILKDDPLQNEPDRMVQAVKNIRTLPEEKQEAFLDLINAFFTLHK